MTTNQARRDRECAENAARRAEYARRIAAQTIPTKNEAETAQRQSGHRNTEIIEEVAA